MSTFTSQKDGAMRKQVSILAVPGADFYVRGVVASLDLHIGLLVLTSKHDHKPTRFYLDPFRYYGR